MTGNSSRQRLWATLLILGAGVLIFVLGRTGAFLNFDVRPEYHSSHGERWSRFAVLFAYAHAMI